MSPDTSIAQPAAVEKRGDVKVILLRVMPRGIAQHGFLAAVGAAACAQVRASIAPLHHPGSSA
ncbi:MAG: hypothetical protein ACI4L8_12045, partial [Candidatus Fimadaptatus sp.]